MLVLIGLEKPGEREHGIKQLHAMIRHAKSETWQGVEVEAAISRVYTSDTVHLPKAYQDIADCFDYRHIDADDAIIDFLQIHPTWNVYAPLDEIEKAAQCLVVGNAGECIRIIEAIIRHNEERRVHRAQLVTVARTIFYELVKHGETTDVDAKRIVALEKAFLQQLEPPAGASDIRSALIRTVRTIAESARSDPKRKLDPASVAQYIETHYMDNLHLDHMAEKLQTTPKYFSNFFKRTFAINFVEYLNKVRLHQAKQLLKNTELSISEIGEKTGYLNASTFTTTFKKHYGISPSEYRKQLKP